MAKKNIKKDDKMLKTMMTSMSMVNVALIIADHDLNIIMVNDRCNDFLQEEDLVGKNIKDTLPFVLSPDSIYNVSFGKYVISGNEVTMLSEVYDARFFSFWDGEKEVIREFFVKAMDNIREPITMWDENSNMYYINKTGEILEGHHSADVLGKNLQELYKMDDESYMAAARVMKTKKPILGIRQDFIVANGKENHVVTNSYPVFNKDKIIGAISMMENIVSLDETYKSLVMARQVLNLDNKQIDSEISKENITIANYKLSDIVFHDERMRAVIDRAEMIANTDSPVLIYGETGTGKELFAQGIHNASPRARAPFVALNCSAIAATLLEGILFGTEKGAFTGAETRKGLLETADKGTLFLDEINSMDISLQPKLLRFLQDGTFRRVGGTKNIHTNIRIISATNTPPGEAVQANLLREDLYYRLGVVVINIPPLRERDGDVAMLIRSFIHKINGRIGKNVTSISVDALQVLQSYPWPGNVRELEHAIEYAINVIPYEETVITEKHLPDHILDAAPKQGPATDGSPQIPGLSNLSGNKLNSAASLIQRHLIEEALSSTGGNISKAAESLGVSRQNLQQYMKKLSITP